MSSSSTSEGERNKQKRKKKTYKKQQKNERKRVSIVWSYFEKVDRLKVRCKICEHEQNYQGTTGNILRHLKSKHDIDATLKGQSENPNIAKVALKMQRIKSHDESDSNNRTTRSRTKQNTDEDNDPYAAYSNFENYLNSNQETTTTKANSVEEQRILAEIEYYKEKAAYYRMQKNLTALQARKVKYELDQLCSL